MADYKHRFVIIYSVDKRFELNKRSLDIRKGGNQKHERHDPPCFNLPSWTSGTMHTMQASSERNSGPYMSTCTAYCSLRNEMGRNEMEMEICSLRNGNL